MKPVVLVAVMLFSQFLFAAGRSPITKDRDLQVLYSELKYIESESLRVEITIEILEDRLHENPILDNPEDLFLQLESLYKYSATLDEYYRELNHHWNQLLGTHVGASITLTPDQFSPIPIISNKYLAGPSGDAIPYPTYLPISIE